MAGSRNRTAGHNFERDTVNRLKKSGLFPNACSTRTESKNRDDAKVDIMNKDEFENGRIPYNIQCKNYVKSLAYKGLLDEIKPAVGTMPVIFHKQTAKSASGRFMEQGTFALMYLDDFYEMMKYRKAYEHLHSSLTEKQKAELAEFGLT